MPYKLNGKILPTNRAFVDSEGGQYPANWLNNATDAQKAAVPTGGITWEADPTPYDGAFYYSAAANSERPLADLKSKFIQESKDEAQTRLAQTDWMVIRKADKGTAIPSDTQTYRDNVRSTCVAREATINACDTVDKLRQTMRGLLGKEINGTESNGATEVKKDDGTSHDPKQWANVPNPDLLEQWPES